MLRPRKGAALSLTNSLNAGMNANLNVNMDMGSIKEPQSRLRKWTTVDSISANTSLDQNASKNGKLSQDEQNKPQWELGGQGFLCCIISFEMYEETYQGFISKNEE